MPNYKLRNLISEKIFRKTKKGNTPIIKVFHKVWLDDSQCIQIMKYGLESNKPWYPQQYLQIPLNEYYKFVQLVNDIPKLLAENHGIHICVNCGHPIIEHPLDEGIWQHGQSWALAERECYYDDCQCKEPKHI